MFHPLRVVLALATGFMLVMDALPLLTPARVEAASSQQAEKGLRLLMVERRGCIWCAAFRREIAPGYATTPEGRRAPIVTVDIDGPWPDGLAIGGRPYLTPTFILLRDGQEISRLTGYPGPRHFYPMLSKMMREAGIAAK